MDTFKLHYEILSICESLMSARRRIEKLTPEETEQAIELLKRLKEDLKSRNDSSEMNSEVDKSVDIKPERHGHWIRPSTAATRSYKWQCSECQGISHYVYNGGKRNKNCICKFKFCPNCGARMDGKDCEG